MPRSLRHDDSDNTIPGITIIDRYSGRQQQEQVVSERTLRWIYGTKLGELSLHALFKRAILSRLIGYVKDSPLSARSLPAFVREYNINLDEAELPLHAYESFNAFFTRRLKPGARPVCPDPQLALPADGRHSAWQDASDLQGGYIKGQRFDLPALLDDAALAERYRRGSMLISRLAPVDYHRFHFVAAGMPEAPVYLPGPLASVSPYCLRQQLAWLWTNKREMTLLHTKTLGTVISIAVGATGVGAIRQTYHPDRPVRKGDEQGYFAFGGSTVITLFEPGRIRFDADLIANTAAGYETYARQGDSLGTPARI